MKDMHPHLKRGEDYTEPLVRWTPVETVALVIIPAIGRVLRQSWHRVARLLNGPPKP
jgi:hypothetical protein